MTQIKSTLIISTSVISAVTIIELYALSLGINGTVMNTSMTVIGATAGIAIRSIYGKLRKNKNV